MGRALCETLISPQSAVVVIAAAARSWVSQGLTASCGLNRKSQRLRWAAWAGQGRAGQGRAGLFLCPLYSRTRFPDRRVQQHEITLCYLQCRARQILLEQVERCREKQDVLHQEAEWQRHDRKSARLAGPRVGQEGYDSRGTDEGHDRPKRAQDAEPRAPIAEENEGAEDEFGRPEKVARPRTPKAGSSQKTTGLWLIRGTSISIVY